MTSFINYRSTMQELNYEMKEDCRIGEKLTSIISLNYITKCGSHVRTNFILCVDKNTYFNLYQRILVLVLACVLLFISQFGVEQSWIEEIFFVQSSKPVIEKVQPVFTISNGGDNTPLWSPRLKHGGSPKGKSRSSMAMSNNPNYARRRLFEISSRSRTRYSPHGPAFQNPYIEENNRSAMKQKLTMRKTQQNSDNEAKGQSQVSSNKKKVSSEESNVTSSPSQNTAKKTTKENKNLQRVEDPNLSEDGIYDGPSSLTPKSRALEQKTRQRRTTPVIKSNFEDKTKNFSPAYAVGQLFKKDGHIIEIIGKADGPLAVAEYGNLNLQQRAKVAVGMLEKLLEHPDTEIHAHAMGQAREPIVVALNRGKTDYPYKNHAASFERKRELYENNHFISGYSLSNEQVRKFDQSMGTQTNYTDSLGNEVTNIGPIFGQPVSKTQSEPTSVPRVSAPRISKKTSEPTTVPTKTEL